MSEYRDVPIELKPMLQRLALADVVTRRCVGVRTAADFERWLEELARQAQEMKEPREPWQS